MKKRTITLCLIAILLISLTACQAAQPEKQEATQTGLTAQEARDIALKDANLTAENVIFDLTEYETDDGVPVYEIEFHADGWEYDYEIHAETGTILSSDKEKENTKKPVATDPTTPEVTEPAPSESAAPAEELTSKEAEDIALEHAGLKRENVRFERTELDTDDGVTKYEIEFYADGWEYDYEIHAETGKIISSGKEKENDRPAVATDPVTPEATEPTTSESASPAQKLSAKEAENIALKHAGLKRENVRFERTELDTDDGVPEYEIEFYADGWEYSYDIHAETGKIISSEKDRDD